MAKKKKVIYPKIEKGTSLVDTHCHLDMEPYAADLEEVLERASHHGVKRVITVGIDTASSEKAIELAEKYSEIYATVGTHPHNTSGLDDFDYESLARLAAHPKVVAYGEIGIDLFHNFSPPDVQKEHFSKQVQLAKELDLPLIIHDRDAHGDVLDILESFAPYPAGGIMHCFSGDSDFAGQVIDLGFFISIPGVVTFKKSDILRDAVREVPMDRLILETDGPYLSPEPRRGRRNEPAYLLFTAAKVAEIKDVTLDELVQTTTLNAEKIFNLPKVK